jgi:hypothetical protein
MNRIIRSAAVIFAVALAMPAFAQQTRGEKADEAGRDIKRTGKKAVNRTDEALCTGTKAECEAKKAKHRVGETKDRAVDGAKSTVDKVD